jgi:hypothetical protein
MNRNETERIDESLESLISAEENAALARFRASGFEAKIQRRIAGRPRAAGRRGIFTFLSPAGWGAVAGGLAAGALLLAILLPPKTGTTDIARSIERFLEQNPGILAQESGTASVEQKKTGLPVSGPAGQPLSLEEMYKILFIDMSIERVLSLVTS